MAKPKKTEISELIENIKSALKKLRFNPAMTLQEYERAWVNSELPNLQCCLRENCFTHILFDCFVHAIMSFFENQVFQIYSLYTLWFTQPIETFYTPTGEELKELEIEIAEDVEISPDDYICPLKLSMDQLSALNSFALMELEKGNKYPILCLKSLWDSNAIALLLKPVFRDAIDDYEKEQLISQTISKIGCLEALMENNDFEAELSTHINSLQQCEVEYLKVVGKKTATIPNFSQQVRKKLKK